MYIGIKKCKEHKDGSATISFELDQEAVQTIISDWIMETIIDKANETLNERKPAPKILNENGGASETDRELKTEITEQNYLNYLFGEDGNEIPVPTNKRSNTSKRNQKCKPK